MNLAPLDALKINVPHIYWYERIKYEHPSAGRWLLYDNQFDYHKLFIIISKHSDEKEEFVPSLNVRHLYKTNDKRLFSVDALRVAMSQEDDEITHHIIRQRPRLFKDAALFAIEQELDFDFKCMNGFFAFFGTIPFQESILESACYHGREDAIQLIATSLTIQNLQALLRGGHYTLFKKYMKSIYFHDFLLDGCIHSKDVTILSFFLADYPYEYDYAFHLWSSIEIGNAFAFDTFLPHVPIISDRFIHSAICHYQFDLLTKLVHHFHIDEDAFEKMLSTSSHWMIPVLQFRCET